MPAGVTAWTSGAFFVAHAKPTRLSASNVPLQSARRKFTMSESNQESALRAIEKALALMHSVQTLEGTDKDGVEHLLEMAVSNLKK